MDKVRLPSVSPALGLIDSLQTFSSDAQNSINFSQGHSQEPNVRTSNTSKKLWSCPDMISPTERCTYTTKHASALTKHRKLEHGYQPRPRARCAHNGTYQFVAYNPLASHENAFSSMPTNDSTSGAGQPRKRKTAARGTALPRCRRVGNAQTSNATDSSLEGSSPSTPQEAAVNYQMPNLASSNTTTHNSDYFSSTVSFPSHGNTPPTTYGRMDAESVATTCFSSGTPVARNTIAQGDILSDPITNTYWSEDSAKNTPDAQWSYEESAYPTVSDTGSVPPVVSYQGDVLVGPTSNTYLNCRQGFTSSYGMETYEGLEHPTQGAHTSSPVISISYREDGHCGSRAVTNTYSNHVQGSTALYQREAYEASVHPTEGVHTGGGVVSYHGNVHCDPITNTYWNHAQGPTVAYSTETFEESAHPNQGVHTGSQTISYQRDGHSDPSPATNTYHQMETYPYQGFAHPSLDAHTGSAVVSNQGDVPFDPITNTYWHDAQGSTCDRAATPGAEMMNAFAGPSSGAYFPHANPELASHDYQYYYQSQETYFYNPYHDGASSSSSR